MARTSLIPIGQRNNIIHKYALDKNVFLYEDHRTSVNVIFELRQLLQIDEPIDLFLFDDHDDFCQPKDSVLASIDTILSDLDLRKLYPIVEFDLNSLDDDWIKFAMELGIVKNVFLFNSEQSHISDKEIYKTKNFGDCKLYNIGNIWYELYGRGKLHDMVKMDKHEDLFEDMGWIPNKGKFEFVARRPFMVDIDLDCFSTEVLDIRKSIPWEILSKKLTDFYHPTYHYYHTPKDFIQMLVKNSLAVNICFENGCCGGINESHYIFKMIDDIIFEGDLGKGFT